MIILYERSWVLILGSWGRLDHNENHVIVVPPSWKLIFNSGNKRLFLAFILESWLIAFRFLLGYITHDFPIFNFMRSAHWWSPSISSCSIWLRNVGCHSPTTSSGFWNIYGQAYLLHSMCWTVSSSDASIMCCEGFGIRRKVGEARFSR